MYIYIYIYISRYLKINKEKGRLLEQPTRRYNKIKRFLQLKLIMNNLCSEFNEKIIVVDLP